MSTSKSSFLSRSRLVLSRLLGKPTVHVCGLLGTYNIEGGPTQDDDFWMATDFIALRQLLGARDDLSEWFCGKPIRTQRGFLLRDPACDRIVFNPPPFETVLDVEPLAVSFLIAVSKASSRLSDRDTLVIVLVGHGDDQSHAFIVGDENQHFGLKKETLEQVVRGTKGNILVISTACFSGSWKSEHWTLLAAAGPDQVSVSTVVSSSGECRGGFFTNALLAEHGGEFDVRPPYPGPIGNNGRCCWRRSRDFGPEKTTSPSPRQPKRSMQDVLNWIYRFRNDIGWTADIVFQPCQLGSHHLPFASLISGSAPFHKLTCVGPSPHASIRSANTSISPLRNLPSPRTLSEEEEATLVNLAADHLHFMPPSVASELPTILQCHQMIHGVKRGREPLSNAKRSKLHSTLTNMAYQRDLALMIAKSLGWERAVAELGGPGGLQRQVADVVALRREAEASGCLVSILTFPVNPYTRWAGAAGWLARVWEASGHLIVLPNDWTLAVEQALISVRKCC
jgi:hypothetical protein